ncbi:hypothetical protein PWT90_02370 [Aphanocladium album]|nr:hypothetical protein PWT90_02370 [Aphanocladium album]
MPASDPSQILDLAGFLAAATTTTTTTITKRTRGATPTMDTEFGGVRLSLDFKPFVSEVPNKFRGNWMATTS